MPGPRTATTSPGPVCGTVAPQRTPAPIGLNNVAVTGSSPSGTFSSMLSLLKYWYWAYPPQRPGLRSAGTNP